jgi:ABC-type transport system involved in multi-copper enzyme maturation permease subunit
MRAPMLARTFAIALNTYREAARDRVPLALFGSGLGVGIASVLVAAMSLGRDRAEVVAVLASASLSLFALVGAIVLGAAMLYKDLERKTLFPILARPVRRHEIILGKHLGLVAMVATFTLLDGALALTLSMCARDETKIAQVVGAWIVEAIVGVAVMVRVRDRSQPLLPFAAIVFATQFAMAGPLRELRLLIVSSVVLAVLEASIVSAIAFVFGAFSSPILTAALTVGVVLIGRNADLLAKLPVQTFGAGVSAVGRGLARVVPNLHLYVPPRIITLGRVGSLWGYVGDAIAYGVLYTALALVGAALIFRRRDFA